MYYEWVHQHRKQLAFGALVLFVAIVAWAIITFVSRIGKVPLTIKTVPNSARITLGDSTTGNGTTWVKPGSYTIRVSKEGFVSQSKRITVTTQKKQNVTATALTAESSEAKEWAKKHEADYLAIQEYGAIEANTYGQYIATKHPITKVLPFNDPYYQITYTIREDDEISLTIATPSPRYRYYALDKLRDLGFNPTNYRIDFKDFHNPLAHKEER